MLQKQFLILICSVFLIPVGLYSQVPETVIRIDNSGADPAFYCNGPVAVAPEISIENLNISNASCTTNALAPMVKVLHENFGVVKGLMNTTHAYTNDQQLLDFPHSDLRRSRAAALSMIPTSTGAAKAVGEVMPELKGRIDGLAIRVPTPTVSLVDFVAVYEKDVTVDSINEALRKAAAGSLYLAFSDKPLVSVDFKGNPYSSTIDGLSTMVIDNNMARVLAWYDNEWAYSCRIIDLAAIIATR